MSVVVVPVNKDKLYDKLVRIVKEYNDAKGNSWQIERIYVYRKQLPKCADGSIDLSNIDDIIAESEVK